jgi:hypothetical protein
MEVQSVLKKGAKELVFTLNNGKSLKRHTITFHRDT